MNENFLLKMRECLFDLPSDHILKKWIKLNGKLKSPKDEKLEKKIQLILKKDDQYTNTNQDLKSLKKNHKRLLVSEVLELIEGEGLIENFFRAFLYNEIGNTAKSNRMLLKIIQVYPFDFWLKSSRRRSFLSYFCFKNLELLLSRMSQSDHHLGPLNLFILYLKKFTNDSQILEVLKKRDFTSEKYFFKHHLYEKSLSPFLKYYFWSDVFEKYQELQKKFPNKFSPLLKKEIFSWHLPYAENNLLEQRFQNNEIKETLRSFSHKLQILYLLENKKLLKMYSQENGFGYFSRHRKYFHSLINQNEAFMPVLYKLIEYGDINSQLVRKTLDFLYP